MSRHFDFLVLHLLSNERDRKVYHITGKGRIYLSNQKERWSRCMTIANKIIDL